MKGDSIVSPYFYIQTLKSFLVQCETQTLALRDVPLLYHKAKWQSEVTLEIEEHLVELFWTEQMYRKKLTKNHDYCRSFSKKRRKKYLCTDQKDNKLGTAQVGAISKAQQIM